MRKRSMAAPKEWTGLNVLATCAGSESTVTFWAAMEMESAITTVATARTGRKPFSRRKLPSALASRTIRINATLLLKRFNSPENRKQNTTEILTSAQTVGRPTIIPAALDSDLPQRIQFLTNGNNTIGLQC